MRWVYKVILVLLLFYSSSCTQSEESEKIFTSENTTSATAKASQTACDIISEDVISSTSEEPYELNTVTTELINNKETFQAYINFDEIKAKLNEIYVDTNNASCDDSDIKEKIILDLMKRNTICIYTYYTDYCIEKECDDKGGIIVNEDGYIPVTSVFFEDYSELTEYLYATYKYEYVDSLISYKENEEAFGYGGYYKTQIIEKQEKLYYYKYSPFMAGMKFIDLYDIEIVSLGENECSFLYTAKIDLESYNKIQLENNGMMMSESDIVHKGKIVLEDGKWKLENMILAF